MADLGELSVQITAKMEEFERRINAAIKKAEDFGKKSKKAGKDSQSGFSKAGASAAKMLKQLAPIAGAAAAITLLVKTAKQSEAAFFEQEKAVSLLNASLRSTGQYSAEASKDIQDFASEMQGLTTVGDETSIQLAQYAISAGLSADAAKQATQDAIALSRAFGVDLNAAIKATTNAQQGNYDLLNRYLPAVRNASDETEKAAVAQQSLARAFDVARAEAQTGAGTQQQLSNAVGDSMEIIGGYISGALTPARRALTEWITETNNAIAAQQNLNAVLSGDRGGDAVSAYEEQKKVVAELEQRLKSVGEQEFQNENYRQAAINSINKALEREQEKLRILDKINSQRAIEADYAAQSAARQSEANRQLEEQAAAEAAAAEQALKDMEALQAAFDKTHEGQVQALQEQIAYFETFKQGPMAIAVLDELREKLQELQGVSADTEISFLGPMNYDDRLDEIDSFLQSEQDRITEAYTQRRAVLLASMEQEGADKEAHQETMKALEQQFMSDIENIRVNGLSRIEQFQEMSWHRQTSNILGELAGLTQGLDRENKAQFAIMKAGAIATAIVNTYEGISHSLANYPMPIAAVMAAAHAAAGFANVANIRSQSYGSSSGAGSAPAAPAAAQTAAQPSTQRSLLVQGDFSSDALFTGESVRMLMDKIAEAQNDGYQVVM